MQNSMHTMVRFGDHPTWSCTIACILGLLSYVSASSLSFPTGVDVHTDGSMSNICSAILQASTMETGSTAAAPATMAWSNSQVLCVAQTRYQSVHGKPWIGVSHAQNMENMAKCETMCPHNQQDAFEVFASNAVITDTNTDLFRVHWACLTESVYNTNFEICMQAQLASNSVGTFSNSKMFQLTLVSLVLACLYSA